MRKIRPDEVTFTVQVEQDDIPVRGNAIASGDDEEDRKYEEEILARLDRGDYWAWAYVVVTATLTLPDGSTIKGTDGLGGCCYKDEADFMQSGGYCDDMKRTALDNLQREIENQIARGAALAELFKE